MACVFAVFARRSPLRAEALAKALGEGGPGTKVAEDYVYRGTRFRASREGVMVHRVS